MNALDLQALLGIAVFVGLAVPFSESRRAIRWRLVATALGLQVLICALFLRVPWVARALGHLNGAVEALGEATRTGTSFVFGYVGGGAAPFATVDPAHGFVLGFQSLMIILVVSALSAVLWHWRVLPVLIGALAGLFRRILGTGGAAGFAVTANVFAGQVEAPLLVRPFIAGMTRYELLLLMTAGMAMIAGSVMVIYSVVLAQQFANIPAQLLTKSFMSIPSSILFAHILVPTGANDATPVPVERPYRSSFDALTRGTADGLSIWLNVIAILVVLVATVALVDRMLALVPHGAGAPLTLEALAGRVFTPLVWLMGVPWGEAPASGELLGIKTMLNEFIAYLKMADLPAAALSPRTRLVTIYALCGFANFGSLGIQVSGIGAMAPERRDDLNDLALRSLYAATLASLTSGAIVGLVAG